MSEHTGRSGDDPADEPRHASQPTSGHPSRCGPAHFPAVADFDVEHRRSLDIRDVSGAPRRPVGADRAPFYAVARANGTDRSGDRTRPAVAVAYARDDGRRAVPLTYPARDVAGGVALVATPPVVVGRPPDAGERVPGACAEAYADLVASLYPE